MALTALAQKVYDALPQDGSKVGGITLQRTLSISKLDLKKAKEELKAEGLVVAGQGRGGSLGRVEGKEPSPAKVVTKEERMAHAREAKAAKSREQRDLDHQVELIERYFKETFGYTIQKRSDICFSEGRPVVAVWKGSSARMVEIPLLEWDKLRASYI